LEKNNSKGTQGYTLVELVTVMAIIGILGTMLVSMLNIGVQFYRTENSTMDNQNNARLAIAYITVKIRQNDIFITDVANVEANGISVISDTVLKINDTSSTTGNDVFWIYFDHSKLLEHIGTDFVPDLLNDTEIAELSHVKFEQYGANVIRFKVKSIDGSVDITQDITLRSSP